MTSANPPDVLTCKFETDVSRAIVPDPLSVKSLVVTELVGSPLVVPLLVVVPKTTPPEPVAKVSPPVVEVIAAAKVIPLVPVRLIDEASILIKLPDVFR